MVKEYSEVFKEVIRRIEKLKISYVIVGAFASVVYGDPRLTNDLDIVIILKREDVKKFCHSFPLEEFYCPPEEAFLKKIERNGQLNLIHHKTGLKVDLIIREKDDYCLSAFKRKKKLPIFKGAKAFFASPEDVIIGKLKYYKEGGSEKHLRDIKAILALQKAIDKNYIEIWINKLNLAAEWQKALNLKL